jgi:hypothetical protein
VTDSSGQDVELTRKNKGKGGLLLSSRMTRNRPHHFTQREILANKMETSPKKRIVVTYLQRGKLIL